MADQSRIAPIPEASGHKVGHGEAAVPLGGVALALEGLFGLMIGPAERFRSDDATIDEGVTS